MHIERTGRFSLPLSPEAAFPFFSAEGERRWVTGWEPVPLHAPGGDLAVPGAVFSTAVGGELTLWLVLAYDRSSFEARYVRFTPGSRLGTVAVRCAPSDGAAAESTEVTVSYEMTSLSPAGAATLEAMTPEEYASSLAGWEREIRAVL
jgi:hypothetical protein